LVPPRVWNYLRIYGATKAPHFLPKFIPDKLVLQEISYQTVVHGVGATLYRDKKAIWPPLPLWVGSYSFKDVKEAQDEVDILTSFHFREEIFWRHDPLNIVKEHCISHRYRWEYKTDVWEEEEITLSHVRTYHDVIFKRRGNPLGRVSDEQRV
jgi:hypothetical protein